LTRVGTSLGAYLRGVDALIDSPKCATRKWRDQSGASLLSRICVGKRDHNLRRGCKVIRWGIEDDVCPRAGVSCFFLVARWRFAIVKHARLFVAKCGKIVTLKEVAGNVEQSRHSRLVQDSAQFHSLQSKLGWAKLLQRHGRRPQHTSLRLCSHWPMLH
jgi:hypothetical protein